jgi:MSHA biogenesis protein MshJ
MTLSLSNMRYWLQMRTQEQRILILISGIMIGLGIWFLLWEGPYQTSENSLTNQIQTLQQQMGVAQQQISAGKKILNDPQMMQHRKELQKQLNAINAQVKAVSTRLVSASELVKALKNILTEDSALKFISLENTNNSVLPLPDQSIKKLYHHDFILVFTGNYFATLNYLKKLEKLPWHFYMESINYEVTQYPEAKITIKLHTVSDSEELMNA